MQDILFLRFVTIIWSWLQQCYDVTLLPHCVHNWQCNGVYFYTFRYVKFHWLIMFMIIIISTTADCYSLASTKIHINIWIWNIQSKMLKQLKRNISGPASFTSHQQLLCKISNISFISAVQTSTITERNLLLADVSDMSIWNYSVIL